MILSCFFCCCFCLTLVDQHSNKNLPISVFSDKMLKYFVESSSFISSESYLVGDKDQHISVFNITINIACSFTCRFSKDERHGHISVL